MPLGPQTMPRWLPGPACCSAMSQLLRNMHAGCPDLMPPADNDALCSRHPNIVMFLGAHLQLEASFLVLELMKCNLHAALNDSEFSDILRWHER